jgi:hypothetical protein
MRTQIIMKDGWKILKEYNLLVPLSEGDTIHLNGIEYSVFGILLDADEGIYQIII